MRKKRKKPLFVIGHMAPEQNFYIQYIMKSRSRDYGELFKLKLGRMLRYKQYKNRSYNRTWTHF